MNSTSERENHLSRRVVITSAAALAIGAAVGNVASESRAIENDPVVILFAERNRLASELAAFYAADHKIHEMVSAQFPPQPKFDWDAMAVMDWDDKEALRESIDKESRAWGRKHAKAFSAALGAAGYGKNDDRMEALRDLYSDLDRQIVHSRPTSIVGAGVKLWMACNWNYDDWGDAVDYDPEGVAIDGPSIALAFRDFTAVTGLDIRGVIFDNHSEAGGRLFGCANGEFVG